MTTRELHSARSSLADAPQLGRLGRHPLAWMIWGACAGGAAVLTRNPIYLALLGASVWMVGRQAPDGGALPVSPRWLVPLIGLPAGLNLILSRSGATVLLEFPFPLIGGPYTLEAFLFGVSAGVQIACLMIVVLAFSALVSPTDLLRRIPAALYPVGVIATIGLTFMDRARRAFAELRESRAVRGIESRGWRDLPALFTPLVVLSLEDALALAETLAARGWGGVEKGRSTLRLFGLGALALSAAIALWLALPQTAGWPLAVLLAASLALWTSSRPASRSGRYRPDLWKRADSLVVGVSLGLAVVVTLVAALNPLLLAYQPYPTAVWPQFEPALALAFLLPAAPVILARDD